MPPKRVLYRKTGNAAFNTLNRPEALNAIDTRMASELVDALDRADGDEQVRAVVLTRAGYKALYVGRTSTIWSRPFGA